MAHELVSPKVMQTSGDIDIDAIYNFFFSQNLNMNFSCMLPRESIKKGGGGAGSSLKSSRI